MAIPNHLAVERWATRVDGNRYGPFGKNERQLSTTGGTVYAEGDVIYSYGRHFPLAEIIRNAEGESVCVLVNADGSTPTTSQHQSDVRSALGIGWRRNGIASDVPVILLPFSAIDGAGIVHDSIRPLEVCADTYGITYRPTTRAEMVERALNSWDGIGISAYKASGEIAIGEDDIKGAARFEAYHSPTYKRVEITFDAKTRMYMRPIWRHYLGESLFTAETREQVSRPLNAREREMFDAFGRWERHHEAIRQAYRGSTGATRDKLAEGMDWHQSQRPALPDNLRVITGRRFIDGAEARIWREVRRRAKFLSAFDKDEASTRGDNYFLATLPECNAETVADAFEALAPEIVKRARAREIAVKRQGDIFAIPCELPAEIGRPAPYRRGHTFILSPVQYNAEGEIVDGGARDNPHNPEGVRLLGTDHTATEVLRPATGEVYARGIMRHDVSGREPDHSRITLGDDWHLIVRNTVPRA